ncbi:hypothetical protein NKR19_g4843 [Coniochaeta hoffmannii]|uniref:Uncharacterized protein n=1 Tax=Coniochaeta hoffmannii TaxID=91930 RepID=A0AA38RNJ8_9PEZI|nr:hypothetical protein NKR19_g4843 [Coniochaeta hoffmannii]
MVTARAMRHSPGQVKVGVRHVTIRPHEIPDYAAHCDGDKFSKACSCISVYPSKRHCDSHWDDIHKHPEHVDDAAAVHNYRDRFGDIHDYFVYIYDNYNYRFADHIIDLIGQLDLVDHDNIDYHDHNCHERHDSLNSFGLRGHSYHIHAWSCDPDKHSHCDCAHRGNVHSLGLNFLANESAAAPKILMAAEPS